MAYPPVVAGGADACTIHYSRNDTVWWVWGRGRGGLGGCVRLLAHPAHQPRTPLLNHPPSLLPPPHTNTQRLRGEELLLLDGGCEYYGYASDVTRTWPVGGRFSPAQQAVYEVVLDVHRRWVREGG